MPNMNIPLPEDLHKRVKLAALMADKPLKDFFTESLERHVQKLQKEKKIPV